MRRYTALLLPFMLSAAEALRVSPEPNRQFNEVVFGADHLIVRTLEGSGRRLKEVIGVAAVQKVSEIVRFSGEYAAVTATTGPNGEEAFAVANCRCLGDYELSYFRKGKEVMSLTLHHWAHARSKALARGTDINISEFGAVQLKSFISGIDASEAMKIRMLDEYRKQGANKSLEPTPTAVTPRATEPKEK